MAGLGKGIELASKAGRRIVPALKSGAQLAASSFARASSSGPGKIALYGAGTGFALTATGFGVDAFRKGLHAPQYQTFPQALAGEVDPGAVQDYAEALVDAANAAKVARDTDVPGAAEFFTSTKFLVVLAIAIVAIVLLARRG